MVDITEAGGELVIRVEDREYARYQFGPPRFKPYLYPLRAANGQSLLSDAPTDYRHHHGICVGHGRVDEHDFWLERHNSGRIVHRKFENIVTGEIGAFTEQCDWVSPAGSVVLTDTRTLTFYGGAGEGRTFDFEIVVRAPSLTTVTLHRTNEAGIPMIRPAAGLSVKTGGVLTNAEDKKNEAGMFGQRSAWVDCSGTLGKLKCGLAVMDHPNNPEHPTPWFARDYGPFSPNFGYFLDDPIVLTPRKPLRLRYRFYTHPGDAEAGDVAGAWQSYKGSVLGGDGSGPPDKGEKVAGRTE